MLAFGLAIFVGAFLLFLVQPLIARFILPWFGGGPAIWTTCMLFFQVLLLGGYAYAHFSMRRLPPRRQVIVHVGLVIVALLLLPITPADHWKPPDGAWPMGRILLLLAACLGLPYLILSATGPLMQAWFSRVYPAVPPYRLYALSNLGSLLALVSYPFLVEPNFSRRAQADGWSIGLAIFAVLAAWCGALVWRLAAAGSTSRTRSASEEPAVETGHSAPTSEPTRPVRWLWFALPACGSVLLLATTNKICQDIAVVPFLWVLPLSLYLLSFIVSFDSPRWYRRRVWMPVLVLALLSVLWVMLSESLTLTETAVLRPVRWLFGYGEDLSMWKTIGIYMGLLFVCCMVCHGEVHRLRPRPEKLTGYYLMIAAGGAFGGFFVAVLAPLFFRGYFELHAGLMAVALLMAAVLFVDAESPLHRGRRAWAWALVLMATIGLGGGLYHEASAGTEGSVEVSRSFYGVLQIEEYSQDDPEAHEVRLMHGTTTHGLQYAAEHKRRLPTTYYTRTSGVGRTMEHFPRQKNRRIGVVGLGTGTMAAWGRAGDYFRIYEINAAVQRVAQDRFTYLRDSPAHIEVVLGDARLSMEREPPQRFDILVLDAFSSDAIPVHLLTREAFEIYGRHLQPDGVIAVHISNGYLDLEPVVLRTATHFGYRALTVHDEDRDWSEDEGEYDDDVPVYGSDWVLLTKNESFLNLPAVAGAGVESGADDAPTRMWTDEKSDLFRVLIVEQDGWLAWLQRRVM